MRNGNLAGWLGESELIKGGAWWNFWGLNPADQTPTECPGGINCCSFIQEGRNFIGRDLGALRNDFPDSVVVNLDALKPLSQHLGINAHALRYVEEDSVKHETRVRRAKALFAREENDVAYRINASHVVRDEAQGEGAKDREEVDAQGNVSTNG